jgi:hypothetical protein
MLNITVLACFLSLAPPDGNGPLPSTCEWTSLNHCQKLAENIAKQPELKAAFTCEGDREKDGR